VVFAGGQQIVWTVGLTPSGEVLSLDPRRE